MNHKKTIWIKVAVFCFLFGCGEEVQQNDASRPPSIEQWIAQSEEYLGSYYDSEDLIQLGLAESAALKAARPDSTVPAMIQLARVRIEQREFEEAAALLRRAILESHYYGEAWGLMGDAYLLSGHYRRADSCYHVMYGIDDGFESLRRLARWSELFGDFDEGIAMMDRAIAVSADWASDRDVAAAQAQLARMFFERGYLDAARDNLDRSLKRSPNVVSHLALKADMMRVAGEAQAADSLIETLAVRSPNPYYKGELARVYLRDGRHESADSLIALALDEYDALELKYGGVIAPRYVRFLLDFDIDTEKAVGLAYRLSRNQRDIYGYELLAWAYYKNGQYDRAWSSIALALRRGAVDPRVVYRASLIAKAAGMDEKHARFKERAEALNPMAALLYNR